MKQEHPKTEPIYLSEKVSSFSFIFVLIIAALLALFIIFLIKNASIQELLSYFISLYGIFLLVGILIYFTYNHMPVSAVINKHENILIVERKGIFNNQTIAVPLTEIVKIEYYSKPLNFFAPTYIQLPIEFGLNTVDRVGIYFHVSTGEKISVGASTPIYFNAFKTLAEKIAEELDVSIEGSNLV